MLLRKTSCSECALGTSSRFVGAFEGGVVTTLRLVYETRQSVPPREVPSDEHCS